MENEQTLSTLTPVSTTVPYTPKVSIGMPVYNGEPLIRKALDSLLAQTFTDFELIISDNASTDDTEAIGREYAAKDARIRYVRQAENRGASANFQFVLDEAEGEYFMWAAVDDKHHPDFIQMAKSVLSEADEVGLVFSAMETVNLLNGDLTYSQTGFTTTKKKFLRGLFRLAHVCPSLIYGLFRKEILRQMLYQIKSLNFDYSDVYLSFWFEFNSNIRIIPLRLYSAGTNGVRVPKSLSGRFIDAKTYLRKTSDLFRMHIGVVPSFLLNSLNRYFFLKATKSHNRLIKSQKR